MRTLAPSAKPPAKWLMLSEGSGGNGSSGVSFKISFVIFVCKEVCWQRRTTGGKRAFSQASRPSEKIAVEVHSISAGLFIYLIFFLSFFEKRNSGKLESGA